MTLSVPGVGEAAWARPADLPRCVRLRGQRNQPQDDRIWDGQDIHCDDNLHAGAHFLHFIPKLPSIYI